MAKMCVKWSAWDTRASEAKLHADIQALGVEAGGIEQFGRAGGTDDGCGLKKRLSFRDVAVDLFGRTYDAAVIDVFIRQREANVWAHVVADLQFTVRSECKPARCASPLVG